MAQDKLTVTMDNDLKSRFEKMCEEFGVSAYTVISSLVNAVEKERKIPFDVYMNADNASEEYSQQDFLDCMERMGSQAYENGLSEMTMEEIDEEIRKARYGE